MKLQTPIRITSLRVDTTSAEYQQIAKTAMQRVALVTDPTLTKEQKQVLYELHMPGMSGQHSGIQRQVTESGQVIDIVQDGTNQKQTYESRRHDGIQAAPVRREILNGQIVDFVDK